MFDPTHTTTETRELAEDLRRLFQDLEREHETSWPLAGECNPDLDVMETPDGFEVVVDVPGISPSSLRVLMKRDVLLLAGEKHPHGPSPRREIFHRAERRFGRFARAVRLATTVDGSGVRAVLSGGELRVFVPKTPERRGTEILVPVVREP